MIFPVAAQHLIISFSGGADSVLAGHLAAASGKKMTFWYLHHYPTPVEPARLEIFRQTRARYPQAKWLEQRADVSRIAGRMGYSWEHTASLLRRKRLLQLRASVPYSEVVTGHHYSDYLETIALRRERRIPEVFLPALSEHDATTGFLRPLSRMARDEVRAQVTALGLSWFEDPANNDVNFARNRVRASAAATILRDSGTEPPPPPPALSGEFFTNRELRLSLAEWNALSRTEKAQALLIAFRRLAIVRRFTRSHFSRAHKLPFVLEPFFAHEENADGRDFVVFRRGLGEELRMAAKDNGPYLRGDTITRSLKISQPYGMKSVAKIFSEKKLSPRQRRQTLVYRSAADRNKVTGIVFYNGQEMPAQPRKVK